MQLIVTLIHQPELIILDEPFSGLDPVNADLLKNAILEARDQGAAIIFSSHNMANVESVCDRLVMLRTGELVLNGSIEEVRNQFGKSEVYVTTPWPETRLAKLPHVVQVTHIRDRRFVLHLDDPTAGPEVFEQLTNGKYIEEFSQQPPTLDEIFRMKAGIDHE